MCPEPRFACDVCYSFAQSLILDDLIHENTHFLRLKSSHEIHVL